MKKADLILLLQARLDEVADVIEGVDARAAAADGPVTPTHQEIDESDCKRIWKAVNPKTRPGR